MIVFAGHENGHAKLVVGFNKRVIILAESVSVTSIGGMPSLSFQVSVARSRFRCPNSKDYIPRFCRDEGKFVGRNHHYGTILLMQVLDPHRQVPC